MKETKYAEEFIEQIQGIKKYWLGLPNKSTEDVVNGVIFSLLVMIDGDSGMNDFHRLKIVDCKTRKRIDCGYMHELYRD